MSLKNRVNLKIVFIVITYFIPSFNNIYASEFPTSKLSICECEGQTTTLPTEIPSNFSGSPKKKWLYAQDPFFRNSYRTFKELIKDQETFFKEYTYLIIKPDGLAADAFDKVVKSVGGHGFEIVASTSFKFNTQTNKIFWTYQSNVFPTEWFQILDMILNDKSSVVFVLRDLKAKDSEFKSASERLLSLKGSVIDSKRKEWHIRRQIGAKNNSFSFIHTPDDAISMMREWGIIFDDQQRSKMILSTIHHDPKKLDKNLESLKKDVYSNLILHDIDFENTKISLIEYAVKLPKSLQKEYLNIINDQNIPWQKFVEFIHKNKIYISEWDVAIFCGNRAAKVLSVKPILE